MAPRFVPGSFFYNGRVAAALLPSLVVLMGHGGKPFAAVLMVGAMVVYILDMVGYREGAFSAAWFVMAAANLTMLLSGTAITEDTPLLLTVLLVLLYAVTLVLTGLWATLQFKWIHIQYPAVSLAFEKLLVCGCLPVGVMVLTFGIAEAVGPSQAAWYLLITSLILYTLCCTPLRSSFFPKDDDRRHSGYRASVGGVPLPEDVCVQSRQEGAWGASLVCVLPAGFYAAVHWSQVFEDVEHWWALLLLASAPLLYMSIHPKGLWWMAPPGHAQASRAARRVLGGAALLAFLAGFEGRVVFPGFGQYIPIHPPWSWILVTISLYTSVLVIAVTLGDAMTTRDGAPPPAPGVGPAVLLLGGVGLGAVAFGMPLWILPAPLLAGSGLLMYLESRQLRDYMVMVVAALACATWFVWHHFWFLDIQLAGMPLHTLCILALCAMLPALLLPGMVLTSTRSSVITPMLLMQALILASIEEQLYSGEHDEGSNEMYPVYLLLCTTAAGWFAARWLRMHGFLGYYGCWALQCVYASKLAVLVVPEARLLLPVLLLTLSCSLPVAVYQHRQHHPRHPRHSTARMRVTPIQGIAMAVLVVINVALARFAIFDVVRWAVEGRPSESLLLGLLLLTAALGCAPLVRLLFPGAGGAQRVLVVGVTGGLLLVLLRPPLPIQGGGKCPPLPLGLCPRLWDERHMPAHEEQDLAMWGDMGGAREHWGVWYLVVAVLLGLLAAPRRAEDMQSSAGRRTLVALGSGVAVGAYLANEFFIGQFMLQMVMGTATLFIALFLVLLQLPTTPRALPTLLLLWATCIPAALFWQTILPLPPLPYDASRVFTEGARTVEAERRLANRCAVVMVCTVHALMAALALKLKVARVQHGGEGGVGDEDVKTLFGLGSISHGPWGSLGTTFNTPLARGVAPEALAGLRSTLRALGGSAWIPTACNVTTCVAFGMSMYLATVLSEVPYVSVFLLAPMLLLLCYDPVMQYYIGDAQRYLPPVAAVSLYLIAYGAVETLAGWVSTMGETGHASAAGFVFKNSMLLGLPIPNHVLFLVFLSRQHNKIAGAVPAFLAAPLNMLVLLLGDVQSVKVLAGTGAVMGVVQVFVSRQRRKVGRSVM